MANSSFIDMLAALCLYTTHPSGSRLDSLMMSVLYSGLMMLRVYVRLTNTAALVLELMLVLHSDRHSTCVHVIHQVYFLKPFSHSHLELFNKTVVICPGFAMTVSEINDKE